jgi:DNA repair protein RecN (Recombination protein N)
VENQLILAREIQSNGRSSARINGQLVTVSLLGDIGGMLVDIHGQSDHFSIRKKDEQRRLLDRYAGNLELTERVRDGVEAVVSLRHQLHALSSGEREREHRRDLLSYQAEEIASAALVPDEDARLKAEQLMLGNADALREDSALVVNALSGSGDFDTDSVDVNTLLQQAGLALQRARDIDAGLTGLSERLAEVSILAEELSRDLRSYVDGIEVNEARLSEVEDRLEVIRTLKRKYGETIAEVIEFGARAQDELEAFSGGDFDVDALNARLASTERELGTTLAELSARRRSAAARLSAAVEESIDSLRMGNATVEIGVSQREDAHGIDVDIENRSRRLAFDRTGVDDVEILVAPNRGESPKPLGRIASGGETARLMLAFKSVLSEHDSTPTLVFDEIDVGVGGRTANVVGERLRDLASTHQVIVITHLPQIAAMADRHSRIVKAEQEDRVVSVVDDLQEQDVEREIAAMLDGEPVTAASIESAREMIARFQRYRDVSEAS